MPASCQASLDHGRRRGHADAERFVDVGAARPARGRSVAVLRDAHAAGGDDQRGARGDIERADRSPPVPQVSNTSSYRLRDRHGVRAHRPREADDFRRPLAFHREADEQAGDVRRRRAALHDFGHRGAGLVGGQILVPRELLDQLRKHQSP